MKDSVQKESQEVDKRTLYEEISEIKKLNNVDEFNNVMKSLVQKAETINLTILQKFIILFYSYYNHLTQNNIDKKKQKLVELSSFMINNLKNENIVSLINEEINNKFSEEFKNYKIFSAPKKKKDFYEICFSIIILSQNIDLMMTFFNNYLNIEVFDKDEYKLLTLENPYTSTLFDSLFSEIYEAIKKGKRNELEPIIKKCINDSNISIYNLLRCSKCCDYMIATLNKKKNFDIKCQNCNIEFKNVESKTVNEDILKQFNCDICKNKIFLYKENFQCGTCKCILCLNCKMKHLRECFSLFSIKFYEIGYKCQIHNRNYIQYCFLCKKNLCEVCKDIHEHMTKEIIDISEDIKLANLNNDKNDSYGKLLYTLSLAFLNKKKNKLFNGRIYDILCSLLNIDIKFSKKDLMFKQFGNEEFIQYYSKLLENVYEGNKYYYKCLGTIKKNYKNRMELDIDYNSVMERETSIQTFINDVKTNLRDIQNIHSLIESDTIINNLKKSNELLKIKIVEIMASLSMEKYSKQIYQENTYKILSSFLSDKLLGLIIDRYNQKLIPIKNGILQIISEEKMLDSALKVSNDMNQNIKELKLNLENKEIKSKLINFLKTSNEIKFFEDITIDNETFGIEDLNKIINILFFIKNMGNIMVDPNFNLNESLKSVNILKLPLNFEIEKFSNSVKSKLEAKINKNMENGKLVWNKNLPKLKVNNEDENMYYDLNQFAEFKFEYDLYRNIEDYRECLKNDIIGKITEIRNEFLSNFKLSKMENEIKVEDIIKLIFDGKSELLFNETKDFLKVFIQNTNNVIEKNFNLDLVKMFGNEIKKIHALIEFLETSSSLINQYHF